MQQFTVPQFIDVEDKIIGPVTARQFVIILVGSGVLFLAYSTLDFGMFLAVLLIVASFVILFGFIKVNGMPFHFFLLNFVQTTLRPNKRIWDNEIGRIDVKAETELLEKKPEAAPAPKEKVYSSTRLAELSLIVDTQGAYLSGRKSGLKEAGRQ
jgi:hypothetical protein